MPGGEPMIRAPCYEAPSPVYPYVYTTIRSNLALKVLWTNSHVHAIRTTRILPEASSVELEDSLARVPYM